MAFCGQIIRIPQPGQSLGGTFPGNNQPQQCTGANPDNDFIAIKIGDLNGSADLEGNCFTGPDDVDDRQLATLPIETILPEGLEKGDVLTLPFIYASDAALPAFQMGIGFDEDALSFIGASKGDLDGLYENSFGLTETDKGRVRMLWFSPDGRRWMPEKGETLFHLSFKAEKDITGAGASIWLDDGILANRSFDEEGNESRLVLNMLHRPIEKASGALTADFYPNPFSGVPVLEVSADNAGPATLWLFNAFGVRVAYREVALAKGDNTFALEEVADLPAGVYIWKVKTPGFKTGGVAVKR